MKADLKKHRLQAIVLGFIAGSRTSAAPAVLSNLLHTHKPLFRRRKGILKWLGTPKACNTLTYGAIPELIMDKLPFVGDRIVLPGLIARATSGALCAAAVYKDEKKNVAEGLLIGGVVAVASAFALFYLRKAVSEKIPDPLTGALEDALIIAAGVALVKKS